MGESPSLVWEVLVNNFVRAIHCGFPIHQKDHLPSGITGQKMIFIIKKSYESYSTWKVLILPDPESQSW